MAVSTNNNTKAFTDAIRRMAAEECHEIDSQTKLLKSQRLTEMKKEIRSRYDTYIDYELRKIRTDVNRQLSLAREQSKKELADLRAQLSGKVFESVYDRLEEYVKTQSYTDMLVNSIKNIESELDGEVEFRLCPRDIALADELNGKLGTNYVFTADSEIVYGGVRAYCAKTGTLADDTLDIRLEKQKAWFAENSGLKV